MGNKLREEDLKLNIEVNGNNAMKELGDLERANRQLVERKKELQAEQAKLIRAGQQESEQFKANTKEITENNKAVNANKDRMAELRKEIGVTGLTMRQLRDEERRLKQAMDNLTPGTEAWNKLNVQLGAVQSRMGEVRQGAQRMNIASAFQSVPGPAGAAITSIMSMGKALWTLVANPIGATIAAIVASLMLLYKAFTSTDSGAVAMEGTLKAIGNVMDILIDRAMSYYKMLWSLVTFDWEGVKTNAIDAFGGIGKAIKDATNAGWDYAQVMDGIDDREAAAQTRMSKLRAEIELLKNQSKDVNKTTKEKNDLIDQAMNKEIELFGIEKGFMKERTAAETNNLASKINNSKMSMEQKQAQLEQWLATDDKELESMMEKDAAFAEFVNKNEEGFQALQKMKAEEYDRDAEFQTETRRLQRSAAAEKKALLDEEKARVEANQKAALDQLDSLHNDQLAKITDQYINEGWTDAKFKSEQLAAEQAHLILKKALLEQFGMSTIDIDNQINQKRAAAQAASNAAIIKSVTDAEKEFETIQDSKQKTEDDALAALIARTNQAIESNQQAKEDEAKIMQDRANIYVDFAGAVGQTFGELMTDQEATFGDYLKATLLMALEALHQWLKIEEGKVMLAGLAKGGIGIAIAAAKIVAMEIAYNGVKAAISNSGKSKKTKGYASGGYALEETYRVAERGPEFIASNPAVRNPEVKQFLDIFDYYQRTGQISKLNTKMILANLPVQQMYVGGYSKSGSGSSAANQSFSPSIPQSISIDSERADMLINALNRFADKKLVVYTELIKKDLDTLDNIEKNRGM